MRNILIRDIPGLVDSSQGYNMRYLFDATREFIGSRTATLLSISPDDITPAEEALWPEDDMIDKLNGYRRGLQSKGGKKRASIAKETNGGLLSSPLCKSLLFGLLTSLLLIGFYLFTGYMTLARWMEKDCDYRCQLDVVNDLIRKFIGICCTACQTGALIVIICNLPSLDAILILKQTVQEFEDVKRSIDQLDKIVESGAKEEIALQEVVQEINVLIVLTAAFVRDLANRKSLPREAFTVLLQELKGDSPTASGAASSGSTLQEAAPLLQAEIV